MLEVDYAERLTAVLEQLEFHVLLPRIFADRLARGHVTVCVPEELRRYPRRRFFARAAIELTGNIAAVPRQGGLQGIYTKDISRGSLGFFYYEQLFPGELVHVWTVYGKSCLRVRRCHRHASRCYEIGADFTGTDVSKNCPASHSNG